MTANTGIGISHKQHARVSEPYEGPGAERSQIEGTGIGLPLSKSLPEAVGGSIAFESEHGKGTTFIVDLESADPPGPAHDSAPRSEPTQMESGAGDQPRCILYIEDNLSNLTLVQRILESEPAIELISAMQGSLGLDLAHEHHPDLIVLDLHLPDISGEEVLQLLQADQATAQIPVIMLSADAGNRQIDRLLRAGANDYLTKPLDVAHFLEVVAANLRRGGQA